ncbi:hypothetical protein V1504DRAFT_434951 [Lipomyces starkeyi]
MRRATFYIVIVAIIIAVAVGIGAGLGVGLKSNRPKPALTSTLSTGLSTTSFGPNTPPLASASTSSSSVTYRRASSVTFIIHIDDRNTINHRKYILHPII